MKYLLERVGVSRATLRGVHNVSHGKASMSPWILIFDVVVVLGMALLAGSLAERFRQNAIIGYLLTGVLLGPAGFGFVREVSEIQAVSELGVALLLFAIGLEFSLTKLRELGPLAALGGTAQLVLTAAFSAAVAHALGLSPAEALALGAAISVSSTAVVLRVLVDRAELESSHGRNALGILLLQDLALVPLGLLVTAAGKEQSGVHALRELLSSGAWAVVFVALSYVTVRFALPSLFREASALRNRDLPVVLAVFVALGSAWASHGLGLSPILGSFVGGMLLAETPFAAQIRADIGPLRAVLVTLFFASIGLAVVLPSATELLHVCLIAAAILVLKAAVVTGILTAFRRGFREAVATGVTLAQTGEFSFVLLDLGLTLNVVSRAAFQMLAASSVLTLLATPYLISLGSRLDQITRDVQDHLRRKGGTQRKAGRGLVLVVGYGPAGQRTTEALKAAKIPFLVLELNPSAVAAHRNATPMQVGDATQAGILEHAGVGQALALVVTTPDPRTSQLIVHQARRLAPRIPIIARARYHMHAPALLRAGANEVIDEEEVVGESVGAAIVKALGAEFTVPRSDSRQI